MRSVINQEYTGDINIIRPPKFWSPAKILSDLAQEDIDELIDTGERTAWPKVEMVRTQTAISRALEGILARIDKAGDDGPGHRKRETSNQAVTFTMSERSAFLTPSGLMLTAETRNWAPRLWLNFRMKLVTIIFSSG